MWADWYFFSSPSAYAYLQSSFRKAIKQELVHTVWAEAYSWGSESTIPRVFVAYRLLIK